MKYGVQKRGDESLYLQLYRQLRQDIVDGTVPRGGRLPSKRLLAEELEISVITVEHALALLAEEGYIEKKERSGCYVIYRQEDLMDTGRNINGNRLGGTDTSGTGTSRTGLFHDLTFTTALITRLGSMYRTERCTLLYSNLTRTVTIGTGLELCTLCRSRTAAVLTNVYILIGHVFFTAGGRFFKADGDGCFYIGTSAGRILTAAAPTAESAEKAVEDITQINILSERTAGTAAITGTEIRIHTGKTETVITGSLIFIGQHLISLIDLFEFGFRLFIAGIEIRMIFFSLFTVCFFNFIV